MFADVDNFLEKLKILKDELLPDAEIEVTYKRIDKASLRILITSGFFIDIYANTETDRFDFSLIKDNSRVFGYDNLGGWHYHPSDKPDKHIECSEPSLNHLFKEIVRTFHELSS